MKKVKAAARLLRFGLFRERSRELDQLILNVTSRCNLRCRHCDSRDLYAPDDLRLDEIATLAGDVGPLNTIALSGGEPFLRPDVPDIAGLFATRCGVRRVLIPTNGTLGDKVASGVSRMLRDLPDVALEIGVSIDGFAETHDAIRGAPGTFEKALATMGELCRLKASNPRLSLSFSATIHSGNYTELPALAKSLKERFGVPLGLSILHGEPVDGSVHLPDEPAFRATVEAVDAEQPDGSATTAVVTQLRIETALRRRLAVACQAGSLVAFVAANGDVHSCGIDRPKIGNIRQTSFHDLWFGAPGAREWSEIRTGSCARTCSNDCLLGMSIPHSPFVHARILARRLRR
jgi:MoaA/NifB/PqqE/SkfB family radical SAM enzyme